MQYENIKTRNLKLLGDKIKNLRTEKSKSLNSFVFNRAGTTSATWSRIENGKVDVKFSTLIKIAAMLDIKIDELLKDVIFDYNLDED